MFKNGARTSPRGDQASRHVRGIVAGCSGGRLEAARARFWKFDFGMRRIPPYDSGQPCKFGDKDKTAFVLFDFKKQQ